MERPVLSDISRHLPYNLTGSRSLTKKYKPFSYSKENLSVPQLSTTGTTDYLAATPSVAATDAIQAPSEIMHFIEKQEDYIEQLEKESKFCRNELSNLLGKVKDVINENEVLTEHARSDLGKINRDPNSESSENDDRYSYDKTNRKKDNIKRQLSGPNIVFESRISELEAELAQALIDLKRIKAENDDLKNKSSVSSAGINCEIHRKQIETLQKDKVFLEEQIRKLQNVIEELKSESSYVNSKRHINDLVAIENSQAQIEIKHLRDELDRQHERVRELQHEMARRISDERSNAERRYNLQVDQLGGDLNSQFEQLSKLQMDTERQKRLESDLRRDICQRNAQIEEMKLELKAKKANFLSDLAQINAEKQSLEQEVSSVHLQLDRADRQSKIEVGRLNAEISSLRQRLDRSDADILHSKRENLRLGDEISNLEKEIALGEMKNEIRPTRKDLDKTIQEMQEKHAGTVNELEEMIQNQKELMDKLTNECRSLTNKLEDTSLKHKMEIAAIQSNVEYLTSRIINSERIASNSINNDNLSSYSALQSKAPIEYESQIGTNNATSESTTRPSEAMLNSYKYKSPIDIKSSTLSPTDASDSVTKPSDTKGLYGNNYGYGDSQQESFRPSDKYLTSSDINRTTTNPSTQYGGSTQSQLPSDEPRDSGVKSNSDIDQQLYAEQTPGDYSQYTTEGYEGYDPQQYTGAGYEGEYDQSYQTGQQYEGQGTEYQEPEQYGLYDQSYQPQISSYDQLQPETTPVEQSQQSQKAQPQIQLQQQQLQQKQQLQQQQQQQQQQQLQQQKQLQQQQQQQLQQQQLQQRQQQPISKYDSSAANELQKGASGLGRPSEIKNQPKSGPSSLGVTDGGDKVPGKQPPSNYKNGASKN